MECHRQESRRDGAESPDFGWERVVASLGSGSRLEAAGIETGRNRRTRGSVLALVQPRH